MFQSLFFTGLAVVTATLLLSCGNGNPNGYNTEMSVETIAVTTARVQSGDAPALIRATGLVTTAAETRYAFKIGGVIEKIDVSEGEFFKKGQRLATLKPTEIDAQLSLASLGYEKAKREYTRTYHLYQDSVATLEQFQNVKTSLEMADKSVSAVAFNKRFASIYAESDGFVTAKLANENEVIAPGSPVLAINETSGNRDWTVKLGITDAEWAAVQAGEKATVTIDAFPGKKFPGVLFRKSLAADPNSGALTVELKLDLQGSHPAIGMFAKATIFPVKGKTLQHIPYDALVEADGNAAFVFVPDGATRVKRIPVTIESFDNNQVYIRSGLENITEVIVSNSAFLNENATIHIIK